MTLSLAAALPLALVLLPLAFVPLLLALRSDRLRVWLLPVLGAAHLALVLVALARRGRPVGWFAVDALGGVVLLAVGVLFLLCALYAPAYLRARRERPSRVFCAGLAGFLATASLVAVAQHLGVLWIGMESMTLVVAPLLYFNRNQRSIEATWKYLILGSVGIALVLLGSFFVAYSALLVHREASLLLPDLLALAPRLSRPWLRAGFVFLFVGYATKIGLAPFHSWKPDAYGEAPGLVGALLSGGATSCAFLALLRVHAIVTAAGEGPFARGLLLAFGLLSMAFGAAFIAGQRDLKRLLAYSSVEQMGVLAVGFGVGGAGVVGALFHLLNNALGKPALFLAAGNLHRGLGSKQIDDLQGARQRFPLSTVLLLVGFLAVTGSPPFGSFVSLMTIARGALGGAQPWVASAFVVLLGLVFLAMGSRVFGIVFGEPRAEAPATPFRDSLRKTLPGYLALLLLLLAGVLLPAAVHRLLVEAAVVAGGAP